MVAASNIYNDQRGKVFHSAGRGTLKAMMTKAKKVIPEFVTNISTVFNTTVSSVLSVGTFIASTMTQASENDILRNQVADLQREVRQLRVERVQRVNANYHENMTHCTSPINKNMRMGTLGKRNPITQLIHPQSKSKRLGNEGRRILESITELTSIQTPTTAAITQSTLKLNGVNCGMGNLSILLPGDCPPTRLDEAVTNTAVNSMASRFDEYDFQDTQRVVSISKPPQVKLTQTQQPIKRRVSFGPDDIQEFDKESNTLLLGTEQESEQEQEAEFSVESETDSGNNKENEIITTDNNLSIVQINNAAAIPPPPPPPPPRRKPPVPVPAQASLALPLPFGVNDLLSASANLNANHKNSSRSPSSSSNSRINKLSAHSGAGAGKRAASGFSASALKQVKLKPVLKSSKSNTSKSNTYTKISSGNTSMNLQDALKSALYKKFSKAIPQTPRTPGDESDVEWV